MAAAELGGAPGRGNPWHSESGAHKGHSLDGVIKGTDDVARGGERNDTS